MATGSLNEGSWWYTFVPPTPEEPFFHVWATETQVPRSYADNEVIANWPGTKYLGIGTTAVNAREALEEVIRLVAKEEAAEQAKQRERAIVTQDLADQLLLLAVHFFSVGVVIAFLYFLVWLVF